MADNGRFAVYTCVTGGYDPIRAPETVTEGVDYICFTDSPDRVLPPWQFRSIGLGHLSPKDQNRYLKMHPHEYLPDHELTLYIDGTIIIRGDIGALFAEVDAKTGEMFMYEHPVRSCIYNEAAECSRLGYDWVWNIARQVRQFRRAGFPRGQGLFEGGVIFRRKSERVRVLMDKWWEAYLAGVKRDQLTLPIVAKDCGFDIVSLGLSDHGQDGKYFKFINHQVKYRLGPVTRILLNRLVGRIIGERRLFGTGGKF